MIASRHVRDSRPPPGAHPQQPSLVGLFSQTFRFVLSHPLQLLGAAIVPVSVGAVALWLMLDSYLLQLIDILQSPNEPAKTLMLGICSAGVLVCLFTHSVAATGISKVACSEKDRAPSVRMEVTQSDLRLYAATLRLLLLMCVFGALAMGGQRMLVLIGMESRASSTVLHLAVGLAATVLLVRLGILLPPLAVTEHGSVLRRSFQLTRGNSFGIVLYTLALFLPGLVAHLAGELAIRLFFGDIGLSQTLTLAQSSAIMLRILPHFIAILAVSYFVTLVSLTVGGSLLYRRLPHHGH